ncbi:MAG: bifunctional phosphopantothenoylcysteine decarboxylase/phosphopantothenate--cysteine ligase CoaBC [Pseudomonadota bacterium]
MLAGKRILLIISGGIAAYKALDLIRELRRAGVDVTPVLTRAAAQFVTPLSVSALAENKVYGDLFDLTDEAEMGHIELSRAADLIVVAPATADLMAKIAHGHADDLASTVLMATDKRVLIAPAMNVRMWEHRATQRNLDLLRRDGILTVGPAKGAMACGEFGPGRLSEVPEIMAAIDAAFGAGPLAGHRIIVTSGPTHEPIDPVRYIANRSSGAQGTAIAAALSGLGADVHFVTGPADVPPPQGVLVTPVGTAREMHAAVMAALPADAAICAAAVADWHVANAGAQKMKKTVHVAPELEFGVNPDILADISALADGRPKLVVGFAAETENVVPHAQAKRTRKGCDWIVANDVSAASGVMGGAENEVHLITSSGVESWPRMSKTDTAARLAARIAAALQS